MKILELQGLNKPSALKDKLVFNEAISSDQLQSEFGDKTVSANVKMPISSADNRQPSSTPGINTADNRQLKSLNNGFQKLGTIAKKAIPFFLVGGLVYMAHQAINSGEGSPKKDNRAKPKLGNVQVINV